MPVPSMPPIRGALPRSGAAVPTGPGVAAPSYRPHMPRPRPVMQLITTLKSDPTQRVVREMIPDMRARIGAAAASGTAGGSSSSGRGMQALGGSGVSPRDLHASGGASFFGADPPSPGGRSHRSASPPGAAPNGGHQAAVGAPTSALEAAEAEAVLACGRYTEHFNGLLRNMVRPSLRTVHLIFDRMRNEKVPFDLTTYNLLLERVMDARDPLAFEVYDAMREAARHDEEAPRPDLVTFKLLVRACERTGDYRQAFRIYAQMREHFGVFPDLALYNILLGYCVPLHDETTAAFIVEEMRDRGIEPDVHTYNVLMGVFASAPAETTLMTFDEMLRRRLRPNRRTYNNLIRSCRRAGDFDRAFAVFEEMKREGIVPDVVSYNLLCATCADRIHFIRGTSPTAASTAAGGSSGGGAVAGSSSGAAAVAAAPPVRRTKEQIEVGLRALAQLALSLLAEMEAAQVEPNTYTFHAVLGILSECCDARLFDVLQHMREVRDAQREREATRVPHPVEEMSARPLTDGRMPTFAELDAMIDAATQRALLSSGAGGGEGMGAHGVEVTAETYGLAVEGAGRLRAIQKANALLDQMREEGVAPTRDTYVRALRVCALDGDKVTAFRHLDAAVSQGLVIDIALYNALLAVLTARSDPQASEVFAEIKHDRRRVGVKPNEETYLLLLRSLLQQGDEARAMEVYREMCLPSSAVTPTHAVFEVLLDMCAVSGNLERANQLMLDATRRRGLAPTASLYAHFMTVYLKANDPAVIDIFATLKRSGPAPDLEVYRVMLRYYAANMNEAILPLFDEMKRAGIDPDLDAYNTMMLFAAQQAAPQRAFRLLEELKVRGMHADIHTYNALLTVFAPTGSDFIFKIFEEMAECKVAPDQNSFAILLRHKAGRQALQRAQEQRMVKVAFARDELGIV